MSNALQRALGDEELADAYLANNEELLLEAQLDARNKAESTRANYAHYFALYERWCNRQGISALPTKIMDLARYLHEASMEITADGYEKYAHATLVNWVLGIDYYHTARLYARPGRHLLIQKTLRNIKRKSHRELRRWLALWADDISRIEDSLVYDGAALSLKSIRDACIFRVGFEGAFRRSELCDVEMRHIQINDRGATIFLPRSKTDQFGEGFTKHFIRQADPRRCSVCALARQIEVRNASLKNEATLLKVLGSLEASRDRHICAKPLAYVDARAHLLTPIVGFQVRQSPLSGLEYHRTVRRRLDAAGFQANLYGSHSLRIGFVAQATVNGATNDDIKRQTGHKSDVIVNRYKRELDAFLQNAVHALYQDTPLPRPASALDVVYLKQHWTAAEDSPNDMSPLNLDRGDAMMPTDDDVSTKLARKRYVVISAKETKQSSYRQPTALNE